MILFLLVFKSEGKHLLTSFNRTHVILAAILLILTFYDLLTLSTPFTLLGNQFRMQGVFLLWNLLIFSLIVPIIPFYKLNSYWYAILLFITFLLSLFIGNANGRAVATIGEPNALAGFVIFLWPFLFLDKNKTKPIALSRITGVICVIGIIFLSSSRSGLVAFIVQIIFYSLINLLKLPIKKALIISSICIVIAYLLPILDKQLYESRTEIWKTAIVAGLQSPIVGTGFGNTEILMHNTSVKLNNNLRGYYVDSAHNIILDWWIQAGIVGVGVLFLFLFYTIRNFISQKRETEIIILLGLFIMLSFNPASIVTLLDFWYMIGRGFIKEK